MTRVHHTVITHSSGSQLYFSIFTVNLARTLFLLQHKVNLYIMAWSCPTFAESQPGARCCEVPKLVSWNVLHSSTVQHHLPQYCLSCCKLPLVSTKDTLNSHIIILHELKWSALISGGEKSIKASETESRQVRSSSCLVCLVVLNSMSPKQM